MSWFQTWLEKFKHEPGFNDAPWVAITVPALSGPRWQCIGVHRLTEAENGLLRHVFLAVIDDQNVRVDRALVGYDWQGIKPEELERLRPTVLDKPDNEPYGNIQLDAGQVLRCWVESSLPSDKVSGLAMWGDWRVPGNDHLHGSYLVAFRHTVGGPDEPPDEEPEPGEPFDVRPVLDLMTRSAHAHQDANNLLIEAVQKLRDLMAAHQG